MSRLMQARGLKPCPYISKINICMSRLMQARGLKHSILTATADQNKSRLMQARGLKHRESFSTYCFIGRASCRRVD